MCDDDGIRTTTRQESIVSKQRLAGDRSVKDEVLLLAVCRILETQIKETSLLAFPYKQTLLRPNSTFLAIWVENYAVCVPYI